MVYLFILFIYRYRTLNRKYYLDLMRKYYLAILLRRQCKHSDVVFLFSLVALIFVLCLAYPDVTVNDVTSDWEFIVLACDGIWDVMTSQVSRHDKPGGSS